MKYLQERTLQYRASGDSGFSTAAQRRIKTIHQVPSVAFSRVSRKKKGCFSSRFIGVELAPGTQMQRA